tara:strand:- start:362 stop:1585 length:1224 start_codon:yes stop_codon:yes gene_type:complete
MDYSENKPIWPGSSSFSSGKTPFGFFDADTSFQTEADSFAKFAANHVGYPIMDVELIDINFYTAFEASVIEYSNQVNQINIVNNLINTLGVDTGSDFLTDDGFTGALVKGNLSYITQLAKAYGTEADSGGDVKWYSASLDVQDGKQTYSIREAVSASLGIEVTDTDGIEIRKVLHNTPPAIIRYFDPFVGTGMGTQNMMDAFDFGGFSPSVNFMMMPLHMDLFRIQTIEFNDRIRKSAFSFDIHGDDLRIYPVPGTQGTISTPFYDKVWFEFVYEKDKRNSGLLFGNTALLNGVVTDASNIPYTYQKYTNINDMGRSWIYRYGAAIIKETLGYVRSKYSTVPIPGGDVTLNGGDLVSQGQSEKEALITQLKEFLDKLTKEQMLTRQNAEATQQMEILGKVPLKIYVG